MRSIVEISDFLNHLNLSKESAMEKVNMLKSFLAEKRKEKEIDNETDELVENEIQGFIDLANFEAMPW